MMCNEVADRVEIARPFGSYPGGASSTHGAGRSLGPSEQAHDDPMGDCRHGHYMYASSATQLTIWLTD